MAPSAPATAYPSTCDRVLSASALAGETYSGALGVIKQDLSELRSATRVRLTALGPVDADAGIGELSRATDWLRSVRQRLARALNPPSGAGRGRSAILGGLRSELSEVTRSTRRRLRPCAAATAAAAERPEAAQREDADGGGAGTAPTSEYTVRSELDLAVEELSRAIDWLAEISNRLANARRPEGPTGSDQGLQRETGRLLEAVAEIEGAVGHMPHVALASEFSRLQGISSRICNIRLVEVPTCMSSTDVCRREGDADPRSPAQTVHTSSSAFEKQQQQQRQQQAPVVTRSGVHASVGASPVDSGGTAFVAEPAPRSSASLCHEEDAQKVLQHRARELLHQALGSDRLAQVLQCMSLRPLPDMPAEPLLLNSGTRRSVSQEPPKSAVVKMRLGRLKPKGELAGRLDGGRTANVQPDSAEEAKEAEELQRVLRGFGKYARIGILGASEHALGLDGRLQALVQVVAQRLSSAVGQHVVFLTEGRPGVQDLFVRRCVRGTRIRNLIAEGETPFFQRGLPVVAGTTLEQRRKVFATVADFYLVFGTSPESALTAAEASSRGAPLFPLSPPPVSAAPRASAVDPGRAQAEAAEAEAPTAGAGAAVTYAAAAEAQSALCLPGRPKATVNPWDDAAQVRVRGPPFVSEEHWAAFREHVLELAPPSVVADDAIALVEDFVQSFDAESRSPVAEEYDVVVIGGGKAGRRMALTLDGMGLTVVLAESPEVLERHSVRSQMQCLREAVLEQKSPRGAGEGGGAGDAQAAILWERARALCKEASAKKLAARTRVLKGAGVTWLPARGEVERAQGEGAHPYLVSVSLQEGEHPTWQLRCKSVVLAMGSSPIWSLGPLQPDDSGSPTAANPSWPAGVFEASILSQLSYLPFHAVIQGSPAGVGYALLLAKLGVRVTMVYDAPTFDEDNAEPICEETVDSFVQEKLRRAMHHAGVEVRSNAGVLGVAPWPGERPLAVAGAGFGVARLGRGVPRLEVYVEGAGRIESDCFIAGQCPWRGQLAGMESCLEALGVRISSTGHIEVENEVGFTGAPGVYAVGGVTTGEEEDMVAMEQCDTVAASIWSDLSTGPNSVQPRGGVASLVPPQSRGVKTSSIMMQSIESLGGSLGSLWPTVVDTTPEFAWAGLSQQLAHAEGIDVMVGKAPYASEAEQEAAGLLKLVFHSGTGGLVGVHAVGEGAGAVAIYGATCMQQNATALQLAALEPPSESPSCASAFPQAALEALGGGISG